MMVMVLIRTKGLFVMIIVINLLIPSYLLFSNCLGSLVRCDFDTAVDGGTITFTVDGKLYTDAIVKNIYQLLGGNEIFPCVSVCPLDPLTEQEEGNVGDDNNVDVDMFDDYFTNH